LKEVFFQELTQFSQGNNVLDSTAANTLAFLLRHTSVSSTQLNRLCGTRELISTWKNPNCRTKFMQKLTPFSQGNKILDAAASNIRRVFREIHGFLPIS
jgi:hypothetical protein